MQTIVSRFFVEYVGYKNLPNNKWCETLGTGRLASDFDEAIEKCDKDPTCRGISDTDQSCDGEGKIVKCESFITYGTAIGCGYYKGKFLKVIFDSQCPM